MCPPPLRLAAPLSLLHLATRQRQPAPQQALYLHLFIYIYNHAHQVPGEQEVAIIERNSENGGHPIIRAKFGLTNVFAEVTSDLNSHTLAAARMTTAAGCHPARTAGRAAQHGEVVLACRSPAGALTAALALVRFARGVGKRPSELLSSIRELLLPPPPT